MESSKVNSTSRSGTGISYQHFKGELSVLDGVLLKGTKIVIPVSMRSEMLRFVGEGDLGIEKCKRHARETLYWPTMHNDTEATVSTSPIPAAKGANEVTQQTSGTKEKGGNGFISTEGQRLLAAHRLHSIYPEFPP